MLITKISHRRKNVTAVYIEESEEPLLFDTAVIKNEALSEKTAISKEEIVRLSRLSKQRQAKERALRLLEFRPHSEKELFDKLKREYGEEDAAYALSEMKRLGVTNDLDYAVSKARNCIEIKKYSLSRVRTELKIRGISEENIEKALEQFDYDAEKQIQKIIDKRFNPLPTDQKGRRRMFNYLLRQGFTFSEISKATGQEE